MAELLYKEESYRIIGSCMKVHTVLGSGFLESVYQEALEKQFIKDSIPYEREKLLNVYFDGEKLKKHFKADFVCFNTIIVELKATPFIYEKDMDQTLNYLNATNIKLGLLVNFGQKSLMYKRLLNSYNSL
jgi:GxxExxY protein